MPTTHDDEWDMPWPRYAPQTSYVAPVEPPSVDPDGGTLVQIPCLAREWIPFVLGALSQLQLPSTWDVADDDAMLLTLQRVHQLQGLIASWGACEVLLFDCLDGVPRYSTDGGATWTALPDCFAGPAGPAGAPGAPGPAGPAGPAGGFAPGAPPNPAGDATAQLACNIAGYLAEAVIQASIAQAVSSITAGAAVVVFAAELAGVVLGLGPLSGLLAGAAYILYNDIEAGTLSDYATASTSGALRSALICAIYGATSADGYVTDANFPAVLAAIGGITYAVPSVVATIHDYVAALGATGLEQIQPTGALATYNCDGCTGTAHWCRLWDFRTNTSDWVLRYAPGADGHYVAGVGYVGNADTGKWECDIILDPLFNVAVPATFDVSEVEVGFYRYGPDSGNISYIRMDASPSGGHVASGFDAGSSSLQAWVAAYPNATYKSIWIRIAGNLGGFAAPIIQSVTLKGNGPNPFGSDNCIY